MNSAPLDHSTNVVATGAVLTPVWLPVLQDWSEISALLLPIAGLAWLLIQIYFHVKKNRKP